jgi:sec-independent protein translocase protein TatC
MTVLRPIGHEERLSVVDHLDELRRRLFVCAGVLIVAFGICFWQNGTLLTILNRALPSQASLSGGLPSEPRQAVNERKAFQALERGALDLEHGLAGAHGVPKRAITGAATIATAAADAARALPRHTSVNEKPVTLGPGESFTTTVMVALYFALLISLPLILYQLYAFIIPALHPSERGAAIPVMLAAPVLFAIGVVFTYYEVLPPAIHFLQGYNTNHFQVLIQASTYYKFESLLMLGIGLAFQVPLVLLGLQKLGIITSKTLTVNWRYAIVLIAVIAAALPGVDPVTMFFETLPLVVLYLGSIVALKIADRRSAKRAAREAAELDRHFDAS